MRMRKNPFYRAQQPRNAHTLGQIAKNPHKIEIEKKIVKLTGYLFMPTLTSFEAHAMTGNRGRLNSWNLL